MVVYSYGQVSTATDSSQELLVVTVKLATRRSVMPSLSRQSHNISVRGSGSKERISVFLLCSLC